MGIGVTELYYSFLKHLKNEEKRIAPLQLTGKIEDYLVKEFAYHIYKESAGTAFALTNLGNKGGRRIDLCLLKMIMIFQSFMDSLKQSILETNTVCLIITLPMRFINL